MVLGEDLPVQTSLSKDSLGSLLIMIVLTLLLVSLLLDVLSRLYGLSPGPFTMGFLPGINVMLFDTSPRFLSLLPVYLLLIFLIFLIFLILLPIITTTPPNLPHLPRPQLRILQILIKPLELGIDEILLV